MSEAFPTQDSVPAERTEFRPSLKYLLTGWRLRHGSGSSFPFNESQERKLCKIIFDSWKSQDYLTTEEFQVAAYSFAKASGLKVHPIWEKQCRASATWLQNFLRRHPNMKDMLIRKQGALPKLQAHHSEGDLESEGSFDLSFDETPDSEGQYSDEALEGEEEESTTESVPHMNHEDAHPSIIASFEEMNRHDLRYLCGKEQQ